MRIGALWDVTAGAIYRAIEPLNAVARRGHEIVPVAVRDGHLDIVPLEGCDVVHIYRYLDPTTHAIAEHLTSRGIGLTWDNDDDYSVFPPDSPLYRATGAAGMAEKFAWSVTTAKLAHVVTVASETLAERYGSQGVSRIEVIPNAVTVGARPRRPHGGLVIGWIAGLEHESDARDLGLAAELQRLLDAHPHVRVECIGVDLALEGNYGHTASAPFLELAERMGGWDVGLAPLADVPFNDARSDIKVKEYAASGVAWLASDLTPYSHLGPEQGGRLVGRGGWFAALDELVRDDHARRQLADRGVAWASTQLIDSTVSRWEAVWSEAATLAGRIVAPSPSKLRVRPVGYGLRTPATSPAAVQRLGTRRQGSSP